MSVLVVSISLKSSPDIVTLYITDSHTLSGSYSGIVHDIVIVVIPVSITVIVGVGGVPVCVKYKEINQDCTLTP